MWGIGNSNENMNDGGTKDVEVYENDISDARICLFYWKNPANAKGTQNCNFRDNQWKAGWEALIRIMPDSHAKFAVTNNKFDSSPTGITLVEIPEDVKNDGNTTNGSPATSTKPTAPASNAVSVIEEDAPPQEESGKAYKFQIAASNSPGSYNAKGKLPKGLSVDQKTGLISGTIAEVFAGTYMLSLKAYNSRGTCVKDVTLLAN